MKPSGSREKLFALAATASPANLGSASLSLSTTLPLRQDSTTDKEGETDSDDDRWVRSQQRLRPSLLMKQENPLAAQSLQQDPLPLPLSTQLISRQLRDKLLPS
jgi:hypothetical protein